MANPFIFKKKCVCIDGGADLMELKRKKPGGNRAFLVNMVNINLIRLFASVSKSQSKFYNGVKR
ncbi:hypothetical protein CH375_16135 [Leptospira ellisii]|nr:hypothetical protein CH375_16135 [Leptospira ellisii]